MRDEGLPRPIHPPDPGAYRLFILSPGGARTYQNHYENKELQKMRNKKRIMPRLAKLPELGTKAAALEGCVDLIARMCGKPETVVRYWLDLYFQVRLAFAVEEDQRRRKEDGCWRTQWLGKVTAAETAHDTAENAAPAPEARADEESAAKTKEAQEPVAEKSVTPPPYRTDDYRYLPRQGVCR